MKKFMPYLWKALAALGAIVAAGIILGAYRQSKDSGGAVKFTDAAMNEAKNRTGGLFSVVITVISSMALIWWAGHGSSGYESLAVLWGSVAASSSGSFNITYVPQFIGFTIASAPTSFQINVQGDGVTFNLDANGCTSMSNIRCVGVVGNTYVFQLADGLINGKNGTVTITNSAAAILNVQAWSKDVGSMYMVYMTQNALASSGIKLQKFAYAAFPNAAAADSFTIEYNPSFRNGEKITQVSGRDDLNFALQYTQSQVTSRYNIDNIAPAMLDAVTFIPAAAQNVYVMNYQAAKGTVNAAVIAKG
jgi:hypothetical protein